MMIEGKARELCYGANEMKRVLFVGLYVASAASGQSLAQEQGRESRFSDGAATIEFSSASGKPLGSVTKIGGTTYYIAADGTVLCTSTMTEGRRVFRRY
jgi:hypothetical protein